jgi:predicted ATPase
MQISRLRIENFRSVSNLDMELGETTVFIVQNNVGEEKWQFWMRCELRLPGGGVNEELVSRKTMSIEKSRMPTHAPCRQ